MYKRQYSLFRLLKEVDTDHLGDPLCPKDKATLHNEADSDVTLGDILSKRQYNLFRLATLHKDAVTDVNLGNLLCSKDNTL